MKEFNKSIFIFRREYRLADNIGLINALKNSVMVIPIFIFTPEQITDQNQYKSHGAVQFMIEALEDLNKQLEDKGSRLYYFYGKQHEVIDKLLKDKTIDAVFVNRDYTPYAKKRDEDIELVCKKHKKTFRSFEDYLLHPVGSILSGSNEIYVKFTPFFRVAVKKKVPEPLKNNYSNYINKKNKFTGEYTGSREKFYEENPNIAVHGGRELALKILAGIQKFKKYNDDRNTLAIPTTRLSAYIKFGCVSIREVYQKIKEKLGMKNDLIKQLFWREFYSTILEFYPNVADNDWKKRNFKGNYSKVPWLTYETATPSQMKLLDAWKSGNVGYPIIDACLKELLNTGFMNNRGRLIVASFLVKNLFFHWAEGEKHFSKYLCDIDFANNNGNWQWVASSGVDSSPYFRVFSPFLQSLKYDPDCIYIKKWLPELKDVENKHIHEWHKYYHLYPKVKYPKPIVDYSSTAKKAIEKYKKALYT